MIDDIKVKFSQKRHIEIPTQLSFSQNNNSQAQELHGRVHYPTRSESNPILDYQQQAVTRYSKKVFEQKSATSTQEVVLRGKKFLPNPVIKQSPKYENSVSGGQQRPSANTESKLTSEFNRLPSDDWKTKRPNYHNYKHDNQFDMEGTMNRKRRVTTEQSRNHIPSSNPGDKPYSTAEHAPNFYKDGELITGTSFSLSKSTPISPAYVTGPGFTAKMLSTVVMVGNTPLSKPVSSRKIYADQQELLDIRALSVSYYYYCDTPCFHRILIINLYTYIHI